VGAYQILPIIRLQNILLGLSYYLASKKSLELLSKASMAQSKSSVDTFVTKASNALTRARLNSGSNEDPIQLSDSSDEEVS